VPSARPAGASSADARVLAARCSRLQQQAEATLEISRTICSAQDLDQLLLLIADRCRDLLHCEVAGFALLQEQEPKIVWRAWSGCRQDYRDVVFPKRGGLAGRAMSRRRPVMIHDLRRRKDAAAEFPISFAEGLRSVLGVPLEMMNAPSGCLMIGYRTVHDFTGEEIDALTSFASQAAIAVENARLYETLRSERARLESVVQSINEGLVLVDLDERVAYVNRQATTLLRLQEGEGVGESVQCFIGRIARESTDPARSLPELLELDRTPVGFPALDVALRGSPPIAIRLTRFAVYDSCGARLGRGYLCRDVTSERQVDEMKTEVISLVSHELRTPLALIRGCASALLDGSKSRGAALRREYLTTIDTESSRLDELVRRLTDVSKLDQGVFDLDVHEVDPSTLLRTVVARWRKTEPQRRFIVASTLSHPSPARLDRKRIEQVLDNLLSNAVKYSPPESAVTLGLRCDRQGVLFSVADRGVGIPAEQRERVFERFYRAQTGRRKGDGSGLGLYISRGIVNAHGGRIWLDSNESGGTTVLFWLPNCPPSSA
jgi:signal transduction histidine kinase